MPCHGGLVFGDAAAYEAFMGRWSMVLAPTLLDRVRLDVEGVPGLVVDVGSGTGHLARAVARRWPGCEVVGVDPAPGFVATARERAAADGETHRVRFEHGDAAHLPLESSTADAALAQLVLNFVPDPRAGVLEMRRVTRAGGVLAAAVWDYGGGMAMLRAFWDAAAATHPGAGAVDEALARPARAGGIEGLFEAAGLEHLDGGVLEVPMRFATFDDYWTPFLAGTGPAGDFVRTLDEPGREILRRELHRRLGDGPVEMTSAARWVRGSVAG